MKKYKQVKINLNDEQHETLKRIAIDENLTIAQYIRQELNIDFKDARVRNTKDTQKVVYKNTDPQLLYHLAKIGNNLNQIAKAINSDEKILVLAALIDIRSAIDDYKYK